MFVFAFLVSITLNVFWCFAFLISFCFCDFIKASVVCCVSLSHFDATQFADMVRHMVMMELQDFQHPVQVRTV